MAADLDSIWTMFRDSIVILSLPAEDQRRLNGPGCCLACDLVIDFTHASDTFLAHFGDVLTVPQRVVIAGIHSLIGGMGAGDSDCFNDEAIRRPVWDRIRETAGEAVRVFECEGAVVALFVEVEPGVWRRSPSN